MGMPFVFDDGGRSAAGFTGQTGDCVTRSIAIVGQLDYLVVYDTLSEREARNGRARSARNGITPKTYKALLDEWGWEWTVTMQVGTGCQVHLREGELPSDTRLLVRTSKHLTAVIDGVVHDTHDPCRRGSRCVYGYWTVPADWDHTLLTNGAHHG